MTKFTPNDIRSALPPGMVVHELKAHPDPFDQVLDGDKRYESRLDDGRGFQRGHFLRLREFNPVEDYVGPHGDQYTGHECLALVTSMTEVAGSSRYGDFTCIMSIKLLALRHGTLTGWKPWLLS